MADIIQILPDAIANQIAAGEVIQRPASAVKELVENAVDAGATRIVIIVKEGGKNLIQVADNGNGMSETDARMCFERHATSKIKQADDLFAIRTKGFRGEALASIAAVAKVSLKTKRAEDTTGTQIEIEASTFLSQEPCSTADGTIIVIKNLFYNIPARRKFLKSDNIEMRHIMDEFQRVALAHPEIEMQLFNNQTNVYQLESGSFRQRIVQLMSHNFNDRLVPVSEQTDLVNISGFVVKPEHARKTRGEQFFFVNDRFIKNTYLHHAVQNAFTDLIASDAFPGYFIKLDVPMAQLDVNIHPTKTEVKFENERFIYAILRSSIRNALGKYNIAPSLDFENEPAFIAPLKKHITEIKIPGVTLTPGYNPFSERPTQDFRTLDLPKQFINEHKDQSEWNTEPIKHTQLETAIATSLETSHAFQWVNKYIVTANEEGLWIIDQHRAHERILYERIIHAMANNKSVSQMALFPETLSLSASDYALYTELKDDFASMGFLIEPFGANTILVRGLPAEVAEHEPSTLIEELLEESRQSSKLSGSERRNQMAISLASRIAIKSGMILNRLEIVQLIHDLFQCEMPYTTPSGKSIMMHMDMNDVDTQFTKNRS